MARITLKNLHKMYKDGEIQAVRDVSLVCNDGEFFCLLGPAGAGKTTLIKLISGVEPADSGQILLDDQDLTNTLPKDRNVAVAFETYALYPQRTVRENLRFPLQAPARQGELTAAEIESRVVEIANLLGIGELLDRLPRQLSGGQRQRVALGRALVRKPKAYLLDEPIAHLDAKLRHRMRGELKRIQRELGVTTIYTTPDQLEALSLADSMAVINHGKIEQYGTPNEIYEHPANVFVARFVGEPPMNILKGTLTNEEILIEPQVYLPFTNNEGGMLAKLTKGNDVLVGIRAKDIQILSVDSPEALTKANAKHIQVLGETSVVTLSLNDVEIYIKLPTQDAPQRSEKVGVSFEAKNCHFFDPITNLRLN